MSNTITEINQKPATYLETMQKDFICHYDDGEYRVLECCYNSGPYSCISSKNSISAAVSYAKDDPDFIQKAIEHVAIKRAEDDAFTERFWQQKLDGGCWVVIAGHLYIPKRGSLGTEQWGRNVRAATLGMGGRRFDIQFSTGERITTHDLWHCGEVPADWRDRFPDTAVFMGKASFLEVENETSSVQGAWDDSSHMASNGDFTDWHVFKDPSNPRHESDAHKAARLSEPTQ